MMKPQFDICIRGAGMVGKTLALLLARERLRVALVRSPDDAQSEGAKVDIRSYALNAASRQILQSLKVWPQHTQDACAIAHMRVQEAQGAQVINTAETGMVSVRVSAEDVSTVVSWRETSPRLWSAPLDQ